MPRDRIRELTARSWLLRESGLRQTCLSSVTTHQHSLPDPCPSSTQLWPHQPFLREAAIRVWHQCHLITSGGEAGTGKRTGTATSRHGGKRIGPLMLLLPCRFAR
jgi:hypothetical protein